MCGKVFFEESITETTIDIKSMNYVLILLINIDVLHVLTRYMYIFIMEKMYAYKEFIKMLIY